MNAKFFDLKKDKQDRMMNAGLKVFATYGYKKASTDEIVAEAGISKGLLFHYFENKIGLYSFLYDYSVRYMTMELAASVDKGETNLFAIARGVEDAKLQVLRGYPYMQQFLNTAVSENVSEALIATEVKRDAYRDAIEQIYEQADYKQFPDEQSGRRVAKMIKYTIDGLMAEHMMEGSYNPEMLYEEVMEYLTTCEKLLAQKA